MASNWGSSRIRFVFLRNRRFNPTKLKLKFTNNFLIWMILVVCFFVHVRSVYQTFLIFCTVDLFCQLQKGSIHCLYVNIVFSLSIPLFYICWGWRYRFHFTISLPFIWRKEKLMCCSCKNISHQFFFYLEPELIQGCNQKLFWQKTIMSFHMIIR